jgi:hypothetical protein
MILANSNRAAVSKAIIFNPRLIDMWVQLANAFRRNQDVGKPCLVRRMAAAVFALVALVAAGLVPAHAENPEITSRRAAERTDFTNEEIRDGFFKIAFGAELQLDAPAQRVRKFDEPVRIFLISAGEPDRRSRDCRDR